MQREYSDLTVFDDMKCRLPAIHSDSEDVRRFRKQIIGRLPRVVYDRTDVGYFDSDLDFRRDVGTVLPFKSVQMRLAQTNANVVVRPLRL